MSYFPLMDFGARARQVRETIPEAVLSVYDETIKRVNRDSIAAFQDKHRVDLQSFDPVGIHKYADVPFWIGRSTLVAQRLELDRGPVGRILDIGMGGGHLAAVAQALGHEVTGTDISVPLYDDLADALGLDRRIAPIRRRELHPDVGGPFDRILIIWQVFDYIRQIDEQNREYWLLSDWVALLQDLARNQSHAGSSIHVELNRQVHGDEQYFDQVLLEWCEALGAKVQKETGIIDIAAAALLPDRGFARLSLEMDGR